MRAIWAAGSSRRARWTSADRVGASPPGACAVTELAGGPPAGSSVDHPAHGSGKREIEAGHGPHHEKSQRPRADCAMEFPRDALPSTRPVHGEHAAPRGRTRPGDHESSQRHAEQAHRTYPVEREARGPRPQVEVQILELLDPAGLGQLAREAAGRGVEEHGPEIVAPGQVGQERAPPIRRVVDAAEPFVRKARAQFAHDGIRRRQRFRRDPRGEHLRVSPRLEYAGGTSAERPVSPITRA